MKNTAMRRVRIVMDIFIRDMDEDEFDSAAGDEVLGPDGSNFGNVDPSESNSPEGFVEGLENHPDTFIEILEDTIQNNETFWEGTGIYAVIDSVNVISCDFGEIKNTKE